MRRSIKQEPIEQVIINISAGQIQVAKIQLFGSSNSLSEGCLTSARRTMK